MRSRSVRERQQEIEVDFFAGGGGASIGIEQATGRPVAVAVNHNPAAIEMHKANHPLTVHFTENVWRVRPEQITKGRPVGLAWFSPDCTHFSRAKGKKPVKRKIRALANVVPKFAAKAKPRVIILENVIEFEKWGPCIPMWKCGDCDWEGTQGQVELRHRHRKICGSCDSRDLKMMKGEDGKAILYPDPKREGQSFRRWLRKLERLGYKHDKRIRNAADVGAPTNRRRLYMVLRNDGEPIVWNPPKFASPERIKRDKFARGLRPHRTAADCIDWTLPVPSIFDRKKPLAEATMCRIAHGIKRYVLDDPQPFIFGAGGPAYSGSPRGTNRPMRTLLPKNSSYVGVPFIMPLTHHGKRRGSSVVVPLPTLTGAHRGEHALMAATLIQTGYGERPGQKPRVLNLRKPMGVSVDGCKQGLTAAYIIKHYGGMVGVSAKTPLPTTTERGTQNQIVAVNLVHMNRGKKQWSGVDEPMRVVMPNNHAYLVYTFMEKYFPENFPKMLDGLVTITLNGELWVVVDIGMRMLQPRELALGNGFPWSFILTGNKTNQIARIGNSVPPPEAEDMVRANYKPRWRKASLSKRPRAGIKGERHDHRHKAVAVHRAGQTRRHSVSGLRPGR